MIERLARTPTCTHPQLLLIENPALRRRLPPVQSHANQKDKVRFKLALCFRGFACARDREQLSTVSSQLFRNCFSAARAAILSSMYSPVLLDHFQNPRNSGELPDATARVEVSNPVCGDVLQLSAILEKNTVRQIRFLCRGCTASIACASLLTESVQGRELTALHSITPDSLASALGGLPPASFHAAQLAHDALQGLLRAARQ